MNPLKITVMLLLIIFTNPATAQERNNLPYESIPDYPATYTAGTVVSRMIDGLGFRYYWATEGLTEENLLYRPSDTNRTIGETTEHIFNLARVIYHSAIKEPTVRDKVSPPPQDFTERREQTLKFLKEASELFREAESLDEHLVVFVNGENRFEYPFWNQINGPIEDAVWHCGQIAALRRAAGNPFDSNVSVFRGTRRNN